MSETKKNLMDAFAGESQANRKYLAYAEQADREGLKQVAKLFRAAAHAETVHAHAHFRNAGKIGNTVDNLKDAIEGETYEFTTMYPPMIATAEKEGDKMAAKFMDYANQVEKIHAELYTEALKDPKGLAEVDYYVCPVCGFTHAGPYTGDKCPVCGAAATALQKIA